jgi:hypothetical protein
MKSFRTMKTLIDKQQPIETNFHLVIIINEYNLKSANQYRKNVHFQNLY